MSWIHTTIPHVILSRISTLPDKVPSFRQQPFHLFLVNHVNAVVLSLDHNYLPIISSPLINSHCQTLFSNNKLMA